MVEYNTLEQEHIEFGDDEFIEVARKKAISGEGERVFIDIARGHVTADGDRRYNANFSIPADGDVVNFLAEKLSYMVSE